MLVKKIFLCGAAERFSAASFWEGGNVDGRKKRRDSKNKRTASGAGQYQGVTGAFGTTGHGTGKRGCDPHGRSYRHYGNTARNRLEGTGRGEEAAGRDAGKQGQALCGEHDPEGGTSGANTSLSGGRMETKVCGTGRTGSV